MICDMQVILGAALQPAGDHVLSAHPRESRATLSEGLFSLHGAWTSLLLLTTLVAKHTGSKLGRNAPRRLGHQGARSLLPDPLLDTSLGLLVALSSTFLHIQCFEAIRNKSPMCSMVQNQRPKW